MTDPAYDLFAQQERVADASEAGESRAMSDTQEAHLIHLIRQYFVTVAAKHDGPDHGCFEAADAGDYLDRIGVPSKGKAATNLRKRLVSAAVNQGKRDGQWRHYAYRVSRRHGGPRSVWQVIG